jgi:hypothetical protein
MTPARPPLDSKERPRPVVRLLYKPAGSRTWHLAGVFDTREQAWSAMSCIPAGAKIWINDVPATSPR